MPEDVTDFDAQDLDSGIDLQQLYVAQIPELFQYFGYQHLPEGILRDTSKHFFDLLDQLMYLPPTGETVECVRKLLEAKDCAVRAALHLR